MCGKLDSLPETRDMDMRISANTLAREKLNRKNEGARVLRWKKHVHNFIVAFCSHISMR